MGEVFRAKLEEVGVSSEGLVALGDRPTALKTRVIAQHQQVVRFDREKRGPLPPDAIQTMLRHLSGRLGELNAVIVSDYGKGVVGPELMEALPTLAGANGVLLAVDPKPPNALLYRGVDVITPNVKETEQMTGMPARSDEEAAAAGRALLDRLKTRAILVTRGERGMTLVDRQGGVTHILTAARDVYDVTGAGDTAISALMLAWAAGGDLRDAAELANLAAGIVVGKLGTATVLAGELREAALNGMRPL
jgi:D-beta-D-heptose 7-phosphate kinase/D-beta-D-heptose 1-phosphate adenosyltransferase